MVAIGEGKTWKYTARDGWKFRGRGIFQITGRSNYQQLTDWCKSKGINADYVEDPDLLLNESDSIIAAIWYWNSRGINSFIDQDDILSVSKIINLGSKSIRKSKRS